MTIPTPDREALARIIDPDAWAIWRRLYDEDLNVTEPTQQRLDESLAKADQWLARSSGGGEADALRAFIDRLPCRSCGGTGLYTQRTAMEPAKVIVCKVCGGNGKDREAQQLLAALPPPAVEKVMAGLKEARAIAQGEDQPGRVHVIKVSPAPSGVGEPLNLTSPYVPTPVYYELSDRLEYLTRDGTVFYRRVDATLETVHDMDTGEVVGAVIHDPRRAFPLPSGVVELKEAAEVGSEEPPQ